MIKPGTRAYSTREVAERLGVSVQTIQRWVDAGQLKAWKTVGGHRRIDLQSAEALMRGEVDPAPARASTAAPDVAAPIALEGDAARGDRLTVMVVDDDPDDRTILSHHVQATVPHALLQVVSSGFAALMALGQCMPDVLITDIAMPHMDGFQMLRHLAARQGPQPSVILVATSLSADEIRTRGGLPPGVRSLPKPVDPLLLLTLLRAAEQAWLSRQAQSTGTG